MTGGKIEPNFDFQKKMCHLLTFSRHLMGMNNRNDHLKACVGITAQVGVVSVAIVALVAIFTPSSLAVAGWIVAPLCLMGTALGYLATKSPDVS